MWRLQSRESVSQSFHNQYLKMTTMKVHLHWMHSSSTCLPSTANMKIYLLCTVGCLVKTHTSFHPFQNNENLKLWLKLWLGLTHQSFFQLFDTLPKICFIVCPGHECWRNTHFVFADFLKEKIQKQVHLGMHTLQWTSQSLELKSLFLMTRIPRFGVKCWNQQCQFLMERKEEKKYYWLTTLEWLNFFPVETAQFRRPDHTVEWDIAVF